MDLGRRAILGVGVSLLSPPSALAVPPAFAQEAGAGVHVHFGQIALPTPANKGDVANAAAVIGNECIAVIDTGGSVAVGRALLEAIRKLTDKPIRYVINTHEHPDHIFGNAAFSDLGATFVGHHLLPQSLAERGAYYLRSYRDQLGPSEIARVRLIPPTLLVSNEMVLDLGARKLTLRAWGPAHSDCDLTVFDQDSATLISGDLVFIGHVPVLDGSLRGWLKVLQSLVALPARRVLPGHGWLVAPWPQGSRDEERYLETIKADTERMISQGVPVAQAVEQIGTSERSKWELFDAYNGRNATTAFSELEWE